MRNEKQVEFVSRFTVVKKVGNTLYCPIEKSDNYFELCGDVDIYRKYINLITKEVNIHIRYWNDNQYNDLFIPRKDLTKTGLVGVLPSRGVQITENSVGVLLDYLLYREKLAKTFYIHDRIGFATINGQRVFLHHRAHSQSGNIQSYYRGSLALTPKGTIEGELDLIKSEVLHNIPLECSWSIGFASTILCILRNSIAIDNFFAHMYGRSSSGKTTSSLISLSPWCLPGKISSESLFSTWSSTEGAVIGKLSNLRGLPVVFDESGMMESTVFSRLVYQASSGIEKSRLSGDFTVRSPKSFCALIISTGENAIINSQDRNAGLRMRVLQFKNIEWTKSASSASRITERLLENYGNTGVAFAMCLLAFPEDELLRRFKEEEEYVLKKMVKKDPLSARGAQKIALISLTSRLLNEAFDVGLHEEDILDFLLKADESQVEERNLGFMAYIAVKENVTSNLNKFVVRDGPASRQMFAHQPGHDEIPRGEIFGRIEYGSDMRPSEVWILRTRLDKILRDSGFVEPDIVLSEWRDKGIIDADRNKFTKKKTLFRNGDAIRVVVLKLTNQEYEKLVGDDEKEESPEKKPNRLKSHEVELIDDDDIVIV